MKEKRREKIEMMHRKQVDDEQFGVEEKKRALKFSQLEKMTPYLKQSKNHMYIIQHFFGENVHIAWSLCFIETGYDTEDGS